MDGNDSTEIGSKNNGNETRRVICQIILDDLRYDENVGLEQCQSF